MQNPIQKFRQSSIAFEKPGILSENLRNLTSSNYLRFQYLLLKLHTRFLLTKILQKNVRDFFYFDQIFSYLQKLKRPSFYALVFYIFVNNSRSKQNEKNPEHSFLDIVKQKTCAKFQRKILNVMIVGARQSFQFFRQVTWFLGNNRALS